MFFLGEEVRKDRVRRIENLGRKQERGGRCVKGLGKGLMDYF